MDLSLQILSDFVSHTKYGRYLPEEKRRESYREIVIRNMEMHIRKFPALEQEIRNAYEFVFNKQVLPSGRSLQFAGKAIELSPTRLYNCSFRAIDSISVFSEAMFILLTGCGLGFSVQYHHVKKLPPLFGPNTKERKKRYLVADSIEGWASAINNLCMSYFNGTQDIDFDFRDIRSKGTILKTSGGKAPGAQPLKDCIHNMRKIFDTAVIDRGRGTNLKPIEAHDLICVIADSVLSGGIRRSATISFFSFNDNDMLVSKYNGWSEKYPYRARANNSALLLRHRIKKDEFYEYFDKMWASGTGEPAFSWSNDKEYGGNPCNEVSLRASGGFCNLTTMNAGEVTCQEDFNNFSRAASFIGTLQASYTDFHYLNDQWKENAEKDALIGVSITGIASGTLDNLNLKEAAKIVKDENARVAKLIGINKAARCTVVKPEGSASLLFGTSSGIHTWHNDYYIRRVRVGKEEAIHKFLKLYAPEFIEDEYFKPHLQSVLSIPVKAPEGAKLRTESALTLLERVKRFNVEWIQEGHRKGPNYNNVSTTVSIKPEEVEEVKAWLWENREFYNGITILPYDNKNYVQAPFEDITKEQYKTLCKNLDKLDFSCIYEEDDHTDHHGSVACGGSGSCELK